LYSRLQNVTSNGARVADYILLQIYPVAKTPLQGQHFIKKNIIFNVEIHFFQAFLLYATKTSVVENFLIGYIPLICPLGTV
jgi:hypothetical protein